MRSSDIRSPNAPHFLLFHAIYYYLVSPDINDKLIHKCLLINKNR